MLRRCQRQLLRVPSFGAPSKFSFQSGPIKVSGPNENVTYEKILTSTNAVTQEPMRIHALSGYVSVLYLVEYPERERERNLFVLDCGIRSDASRLDGYVREVLGYGGGLKERLNVAVATHSHPDHCGAASHYASIGAHVLAPQHLERYYAGWRGNLQKVVERTLMSVMAHQLGRTHIERPYLTGAVPVTKFAPRLADGMSLPFFDDWMCVCCHGHTMHMVGLFHPASGIFYAADLLVYYKRQFRAPIPVDDLEVFDKTMNRLRALPVRWLLLAHGGIVDISGVVGGWDYVVDSVIQHARYNGHSALLKLVNMSFVSAEPSQYNAAEEAPRRAITVPQVDPVAVSHMR